MPRKNVYQKKIFQNISKFNRTCEEETMETEDSLANEEAYDPIQDIENEGEGIELIVNDEFLLELTNLLD
jgi:hypothetical protein